MNKTIYQSRAIQAVIVIIAAILLLSIWPLRIFKETVTISVGSPAEEIQAYTVNEESMVMQTIAAQYDHMNTLHLYLGADAQGSDFYVRILDKDWQQVCEEKVDIDEAALPGYQEVEIDVDMEVNALYYIIVQGDQSEIQVMSVPAAMTDMPFLGELYYQDASMDGMSFVADYDYGMPLRKMGMLVCGAAIIIVAALLLLLAKGIYRNREDKLITVEKAFKTVMNPLVAAGTLAALIATFRGTFGHYALDNTVFAISILFLSVILFYGINHRREGQNPVITADYLKSHAGDLLQSICIAGALAACCEYMSGLYDIHHAVAERKEMIWFALSVIAMFGLKDIFRVYNLIYLVAAGIAGRSYYQAHLTEDMDDLNRQVLKYTVWIAILLGFIVIRTVIALCQKKLAKPNVWYSALLLVFFALIIIFRNGRWWTVVMAAAFTLLYLNYGMWEHKERFLTNVLRGAVLQFVLATGYCLLHRPYVTFRNARYTHIFHTVTITATYLTMIECVAAVLLLTKLTKTRKLRDIWKELSFFGVVSSYMIFTMARTAYFAVGATVLFALILIAAGKGKARLLNIGKNLGLLVLSVIVLLPVTFTLQRNIPALVSEPYLYEIEYSMYCPEDVMRGRHADSKNFMRVGRFIDVFCEKIFGIPEGTFDIYGEIKEYQRTHQKQVASLNYVPSVDDFYPAKGSELLLASAGELDENGNPVDIPEDNDYTNGRVDIYRSYIEQLNMTGHEEMGAVLEDGEIATHAHDIYLQVAYDHGIPVGIVFVLVGAATLVVSLLYYGKQKKTITYAALPAVITVAVAVAGIVEWIYHLSNPCGYLLMLVITPLFFMEKQAAK